MVRRPALRLGAPRTGGAVARSAVRLRPRGHELRTGGRALPRGAEDPLPVGRRRLPALPDVTLPLAGGSQRAALGRRGAALLDHGRPLDPGTLQDPRREGQAAVLGRGPGDVPSGDATRARADPGAVGHPAPSLRRPQRAPVPSPVGVLGGARGLSRARSRPPDGPLHHARRDPDRNARCGSAPEGRRRRAGWPHHSARRQGAARNGRRADVGGGCLHLADGGRRHAIGKRAPGGGGRSSAGPLRCRGVPRDGAPGLPGALREPDRPSRGGTRDRRGAWVPRETASGIRHANDCYIARHEDRSVQLERMWQLILEVCAQRRPSGHLR